MGQKLGLKGRTAVLAYGTLQTEKVKEKLNLPVIDVTEASWGKQLARAMAPAKAVECTFFCLGTACIQARSRLPRETVFSVNSIEDIEAALQKKEKETEQEEGLPTAARIGDITVSAKYHKAVKTSKVWLSTHHLDMIKSLLGNNFKIELLDDRNNVVKELGKDSE